MTSPVERQFWAASLSNFVWLHDGARIVHAGCVAPTTASLATELQSWCPKVEAFDSSTVETQLEARLAPGLLDAVIVVTDDALPPLAGLARTAAREARLYLMLPRGRVQEAIRACRKCGWQPETSYLVATAVFRALHFVPDTLPGLLAWFEMEPPARAWPRWLLRIALRLGWRPRAFGARLLVARRVP